MERVDVVHLDKWVADLLRSAGYEYEIRYWGRDSELEDLWERAIALGAGTDFPPSFFRDEWEFVVQARGCETWEDYKRASRSGRGVRMSRGQRKAVWPVFEEYRLQLERHGLREPEDARRDATALLAPGAARVPVRSIVVDEAQDMSTNAFRHLRINYRTTDEIRRYAVALLEGLDVDDLDAGTDEQRGYRSLTHGLEPEIRELPSFDEEIDAITSWLSPLRAGSGSHDADADPNPDHSRPDHEPRTCLATRTNQPADQYQEALQARGILTLHLGSRTADDPRTPGLRIATMHRVKGLECDRMIIAGATDDHIPLRRLLDRSDDPAVRQEVELMERALLYVALTRAREAVLVTAAGGMSGWVG